MSNVSTRIATGAVLLGLALAALFLLPDAGWAAALVGLTAAAGWEWGGLAGLAGGRRRAYAIALGAACAVLLLMLPPEARTLAALALCGGAALFWAVISPAALKGRMPPLGGAGAKCALGFLVLVATAAALFQLRVSGPKLLLGYMAVIWVSDTAAYFTGRRFGRNKLAPAVSPGKTWEGVAGAALAVTAYGVAWGGWGLGRGGIGLAGFVAFLLVLAALGIVGDLLESALKRQAGVKDSGRVLPGHGGILDRIDALTAALPVAALAAPPY